MIVQRSMRVAVWVGCLSCSTVPPSPLVRPGVEVLVTDSIHLLQGRRVGLLTNQTGVGRDGTGDVEMFLKADVPLVALFSPEHGFRGVLDQPNVDHDIDSATGLPIFSLYGETRAPTATMLEMIDVLVIDLQDIGARPYTYISTTLLAMEAGAAHGIRMIVTDRPNPIGGLLVQGPLLDTAYTSFVGMLPIPLRHGMTLGELARFGNESLALGAQLSVIPAAGWHRAMWFDETGLPWIRPSPNMPDLESATHYPGIVLFEATNLSVGRGTPIAFQVIGAPWLDPASVLARLPELSGVTLRDTVVVPESPTDGKHGSVAIPAILFRVTDRATYDPTELAVILLGVVQQQHADSLIVRGTRLHERLGDPGSVSASESDDPRAALRERWAPWLADFDGLRRRYLLYPDSALP